MHKWHVIYQTIYEARVVIEARDEEELADLMEEGDFELEWHPLNTFSEVDFVEWNEGDSDE